jgi:caa(3)-type oxidase subunit IV
MDPKIEKHHHHILPTQVALGIGAILLFLTGVTVWIAGVDLGSLNFVVAMAVATFKATLVALFFMNLLYDRKENAVIFATSFLFLAIFIVLTGTDLFFRGDVYVKGPIFAATQSKSTLKKAWISTPELVAKGKELFAQQCVSCHGVDGKGDGPAATALNPHPRNFHDTTGWKNGRKPTMVFKTLNEGLPPSAMASYSTLPSDDRWALVHYVLSLGPKAEADTAADFAKVKIDPTQDSGGASGEEAATIPIELAMRRMTVPQVPLAKFERASETSDVHAGPGAQLYRAQCASCHGINAQGGVRVKNLGVDPIAYVTTVSLKEADTMKSQDAFNQIVIRGLPGELMPGMANLSSTELRELYQYIRSLPVK